MEVVSRLDWSRKGSHGGVIADISKNLDFHFVCYKSQYGLHMPVCVSAPRPPCPVKKLSHAYLSELQYILLGQGISEMLKPRQEQTDQRIMDHI